MEKCVHEGRSRVVFSVGGREKGGGAPPAVIFLFSFLSYVGRKTTALRAALPQQGAPIAALWCPFSLFSPYVQPCPR